MPTFHNNLFGPVLAEMRKKEEGPVEKRHVKLPGACLPGKLALRTKAHYEPFLQAGGSRPCEREAEDHSVKHDWCLSCRKANRRPCERAAGAVAGCTPCQEEKAGPVNERQVQLETLLEALKGAMPDQERGPRRTRSRTAGSAEGRHARLGAVRNASSLVKGLQCLCYYVNLVTEGHAGPGAGERESV
eukprot:1157331-Pelagomonas_calceolata.AAC.8